MLSDNQTLSRGCPLDNLENVPMSTPANVTLIIIMRFVVQILFLVF